MKSNRATWAVAFASVALLAGAAAAAPITKAVQTACKTDYKNYCGEYGLGPRPCAAAWTGTAISCPSPA